MSKWEQVANMFDLKLEEQFEIEGFEGTFVFGCFGLKKLVDGYWRTDPTTLMDLISADYKVIKKPWKPKPRQYYWYHTLHEDIVRSTFWDDTLDDMMFWKSGNCFKKKIDAITKGKELMEQIRKEFEEA